LKQTKILNLHREIILWGISNLHTPLKSKSPVGLNLIYHQIVSVKKEKPDASCIVLNGIQIIIFIFKKENNKILEVQNREDTFHVPAEVSTN
jgi:hypothetical protein